MPYLTKKHGFTLIEILVTIMVSAILAVMLMQIMQGHAWRSFWPLTKLKQGLALQEVMENISADYRNVIISAEEPLVELQNRISNGDYWNGQPYSSDISVVVNDCLSLNKDSAIPAGEDNVHSSCVPADTLLKVTISYDGQSLTALFAR
ncbi:MAG: type II secretion system protein [Desulfobacteraceae bacterium]|jgi:prepilin-type N-terminal cleavage/methylation domain-containing protein